MKNIGEKTFRAMRNNNSIPDSSRKNPEFNFKFLLPTVLVDIDEIKIVKKRLHSGCPNFLE
jgi:hypothetical protein